MSVHKLHRAQGGAGAGARKKRETTQEEREKQTHERINQNRVIQSPNPTRIQRLTIKNLHALQEPHGLQPLQPSRLVNIRRNLSALSTLSEQLRGRVP